MKSKLKIDKITYGDDEVFPGLEEMSTGSQLEGKNVIHDKNIRVLRGHANSDFTKLELQNLKTPSSDIYYCTTPP